MLTVVGREIRAQAHHSRVVGQLLAIGAAAALILVWMPAGAVASSRSDWPQFRHDPSNTGYNPGETTLSASNVARLKLAWTAQTGSSDAPSPIVANGVVYVAGPSAADGWLFAYAANCGSGGGNCTQLWKATDGQPSLAPAVANGVVYVKSTSDQIVAYAVGCADQGRVCSPLWTGARSIDSTLTTSSPVIANGVVYIGGDRGTVYAYSDSCKSDLCRPASTITGGSWIDSAVISPAFADGVVYTGLENGQVLVYWAGCDSGGTTCMPLWETFPGELDSQIAIANGVVYVRQMDGTLYAYVGCDSGGICQPLWVARATSPGYVGNTSSPAVANGVVYVGSTDGHLYAFAAGCANGGETCFTPLWTAQTGGSIASSPAVANDVVYVASDDGYLYAYAVGCASGGGTCEPLWKAFVRDHIIGQTVLSSPVVANGAVYVGSYGGGLYAFSLNGATPPPTSIATPLPLTEPGAPAWTLALGLAAFLIGTLVTLSRRQRHTAQRSAAADTTSRGRT